ncbi:MAG: M56 family metallopeptidase, partial [bacterium]
WCLIIPASLFVPGYYRFHHAVALDEMASGSSGATPLHQTLASPWLAVMGHDWWARVESYDAIINVVWRLASWSLIIWGIVCAMRVWRIVHRSRRPLARQVSSILIDGVPVLVTGSVGPATVGVLRARVLVPRWVLALPPVQRKYVIRHEDEHRRAHDATLLFFASLLLVLVPWNLALWWQLRRLHLAVEMDCDDRVVAALGDARAYGEMLLEIAQTVGRGPRLQPALLGGVGMLERRLTALMAPEPNRLVQRLLLPAAALALVLVVLYTPHPVLGHATHALHVATATAAR